MTSAMTNAAIIADSSPLISLAIIRQLDLLPRLYQSVLLPPAVWNEVAIQGTGLPGAQAVSEATWLQIQTPDQAVLEPLSIIDTAEYLFAVRPFRQTYRCAYHSQQ